MPATTTPQGFPYPLPSEPVAEGAQAIRNLAEAIDDIGPVRGPDPATKQRLLAGRVQQSTGTVGEIAVTFPISGISGVLNIQLTNQMQQSIVTVVANYSNTGFTSQCYWSNDKSFVASSPVAYFWLALVTVT